MTQYVLKIFEDEKHSKFRVIDRDGSPWFVLSEVCRELGISNSSDVAARLDEEEKGVAEIDTLGGKQTLRIINESGLYSIILRSTKPEAKKFKKWVTSEVLPAIRKTGSYSGKVPAFIKRANDNWDRIDIGYFSVINELAVIVWGRIERAGHIMADNAPNGKQNRPDVSVGMGFSKWLEENHPTLSGNFKKYRHTTPE